MKLEDLGRTADHLDRTFRGHCARLDRDLPWFAQFALQDDDRCAEYFVGHATSTAERILDWRHPLALAAAQVEVGDPVELPAPFAQGTKVIIERAEVKADGRRLTLVRLVLPDGAFTLISTPEGFVDPERVAVARSTSGDLDDVIGRLTPAQFKLITSSRTAPLIIQGRAGSGKTSVGLYRLAWLTHAEAESETTVVPPGRILMVMFNKALKTYVERTTRSLGLGGVRLDTYHAWALTEVRRGYGGHLTPSGELSAKHPNVVRLKKQLGILKAVEAYVARQTRSVEAWLAGKLAPYDLQGTWLASIHESTVPLAQRLIRAREAALARRAETTEPAVVARLTQIHAVLAHAVSRLIGYKDELLSILTDRDLLAAHLPQASAADLDELVAYQTALQRRAPGDRHAGPTVDFEDLAILLRLMQLKHGGLPNAKQDDTVDLYEHVLIDEAQDFGAVELTAILGAVRSRTGVTIVGDANQKIIPEADFMGWDALARELGVSGATVARLEVPHRSTAPIMALADALVGDSSHSAARAGLTPRLSIVPSGQIDRLVSALRGFLAERPNAHVAVVCGRAREVEAVLGEVSARLRGDGVSVRIGQREAFSFSPGVTVTNLRQIKGLEFDAVFALDVNDDRYPSDDQGRRWLYTLITRAKDVVHLFSTGAPATLLQPAIDAGRVALDAAEDIPVFDPASDTDEPF